MSNYANRLDRLEDAIRPAAEPVHILRVIVDPNAPGDRVVSVIARGDNGALTHFARESGESWDALCERARRSMGWES